MFAAEHATSTTQTMTKEEESTQVEAWRMSQFLRLGLCPDAASEAAHQNIDWHEVENLMRQGCEPFLAVRILR